jgi:hypothetical protein
LELLVLAQQELESLAPALAQQELPHPQRLLEPDRF